MTKPIYLAGVIDTLRLSGLYPLDSGTNKIIQVLYGIWRMMIQLPIYLTLLAYYIEVCTIKLDLIESNAILLNTGVYTFVTTELIIFLVNLPKLTNLIEKIQINFHYESHHDFDDVSMEKTRKLVDKLARYWVFATLSAASILALMPLTTGSRVLPLPTWKMDATESPIYELMYAYQFLAQASMALIFGATDASYLCLALLFAQQFKVLESDLKYGIFDALIKSGVAKSRVDEFGQHFNGSSKPTKTSTSAFETEFADVMQIINSEEFKKHNYENLRNCIKHHTILLNYYEEFDEIYRWLLLVKIGSVSQSMIFAIYSAMVGTSSDRIGAATYTVCSNYEMMLYTFPGQYLTESADLLDTIYECPWYLCDKSWKQSFLLLQMKARKVLEIKAGGYLVMSLPSYVSFMKAIYSYVTVLRQMSARQ